MIQGFKAGNVSAESILSLWIAGSRGERGDKGAKGYSILGYTGDQGSLGTFDTQHPLV